jgi:hypothetical protein
MKPLLHALFLCSLLATALLAQMRATAGTPDSLDAFLREGRIKEALTAYAAPSDNAGRFSLAVVQALDGLQQFSAGMHSVGINPEFVQSGIPFFRVVPPGQLQNPKEPATPAKVARLFEDLRASMRRANATLAQIDGREFGVEVNLSRVLLDFDGDGQCSTNETLLASLGRTFDLPAQAPSAYVQRADGLPAQARDGRDIVVRFDGADAVWLRGYTHFLAGLLDLLLAYDWRPVWDQCAHAVFLHPEPLPPIARFSQETRNFDYWADLVAAVHNMPLKLVDKDGPRRARDEFRAMIACSHVCWQRVLAETDNDKEWLPSPKQTGPGGARITQAQVDAWQRVLAELDAIASGRKLLPHWRMKPGVGINVEKLVASPPPLDLVLLIQGSALVPYLEEGVVSDQRTWSPLMQAFGSGFLRFAIWSN